MTKITFLDDDPHRHSKFRAMLEALNLAQDITHLLHAGEMTKENVLTQDMIFLEHSLCQDFGRCPQGKGFICLCPGGKDVAEKILSWGACPKKTRFVVHSSNPLLGDQIADLLIERGFLTLRFDFYDWWDEYCTDYEALWETLSTKTGHYKKGLGHV